MEGIQRFQDLLRKLFQFESSDLDFGIYRILNYKRDKIEKFIEEDLKDKVEGAFAKHIDEIKNQVFNDLYNFFSRYYEEGDFVPQYRYSIKGYKYAIPYNGEEVKLHWVNQDQYYTKTGLLFRDYTFKADDYKVLFRVVSAKEEIGSNKATKERFFVLDDENPIAVENGVLFIRFQYRELTEKEVREYDIEGGSNTSKQEKINQKSYDEILERIKNITLKAILSKDYKNEKPLLLYQINRFTAKNTKDYFIHKNLKKFLLEQLDYFIKSEVLNIETLKEEEFLDKHITRAKVVKELGEDIIDFLSQIEDFQKRLWEKRKFVIKTEYVITLDKIKEYAGEDFLNEVIDEVLKNEEQLSEWRELGSGEVKNKDDLLLNNNLLEKTYKKLPIDTRYFSEDFKERLLEKLTENHNLDDILDGLLIKSENWQALNLILNKYKEKVQTIYIDPPFNTGKDFIFRDNYQDSTWLSLIENRIELSKDLLKENGTIFLHLDHIAEHFGKLILDKIFGPNNFLAKITWNTGENISGFKSQAINWIRQADFIHFYSKSPSFKFIRVYEPMNNKEKYGWLDILGYDKNNLFIEKWDKRGNFMRLKVQEEVKPKGTIWNDIYSFQYSEPRITESIAFVSNQKPEQLMRRIIQSSSEPGDLVLDFFVGSGTTVAVAHKLNRKWIGIEMGEFFHETYIDEVEIKNSQYGMLNEKAIICIVAEKKDSKVIKIKKLGLLGRMKIVLMGDKEFYAIHSKQKRRPHLSNDINWQGGGFFKYQILEQYEDTLDNIELKENKQMQELFKDEYLLKYFLDFETKESPYLLNIEHLKNPFAYKLKVNLQEVGEPQEMVIDIPETFNYLLGIKVKKIKVRNNRRKYLFILGEKEQKDIAIVWREYSDDGKEDFKKDKEFIIKELESWKPHIVYINGQSVLTPQNWEVKYIEPEFKKLMEG